MIAAAICAALPDMDVIAFHFGVPYGSMLGHRGLTHSLLFAMVAGSIAEYSRRSKTDREVIAMRRARLARARATGLVFLLATASHGMLDAMTNGGRGVAFFAPFSDSRYFFPWHPIEVSPIGAAFVSARGVSVLLSELLWVWIPSAIALAMIVYRKRRQA